jgi:hypothetical protein
MDELKTRLIEDAGEIEAAVSPELQRRIDASLIAARETRSVAEGRPEKRNSLWMISSLTGLAAAALVILVIGWNRQPEMAAQEQVAGQQVTRQQVQAADESLLEGWDIVDGLSLNIESADLTRSLEDELVNLQSDLEKARQSVERDVKFNF